MNLHHYIHEERRPLSETLYTNYLNPARVAVVSIDMHEGHLSEEPECPCPAPRGREIVEPLNEFHRKARKLGISIIHVRSELRASGVDDVNGNPSSWRLTFPQWVGDIPNAAEHALSGSQWTQFSTEVADGDEIVTGKKRLSAFYPTDLDFLLRQLNVRTVVLDGIMADCCVLNSAFDAANFGYRVVVPTDLIRGTDKRLEHAALSMISLHVGLVLNSHDLLEAWSTRTNKQRNRVYAHG